jgi:hypothetical protein
MLVHAHTRDSTHAAAESPATAAAGLPLFDGSPTGMAADTLLLAPLTVQQNVPNIGDAQTAPRTSINPTLEQGDGRSPGWKWGWMRKNIALMPGPAQSHKQRRFGNLRAEYPRGSAHPPGTGPGQLPILHNHKKRPTNLQEPETVYFTAAVPPSPTWSSEPV